MNDRPWDSKNALTFFPHAVADRASKMIDIMGGRSKRHKVGRRYGAG